MSKRCTAWVKLTNRTNGKTCYIKAEVRTHRNTYIFCCTSQQYNRALDKLGHGCIVANTGLMVYTSAGREYAYVDVE